MIEKENEKENEKKNEIKIDKKIIYSVIVPIFNEIESLPELYRRVSATMDQVGESWELILVDDGCTDGSTEKILELAANDKRLRPLIFARNFGHQIAVTAGWDHAHGEAVVIIDADLQDPPEVIPDLIAKWKEGYEVVYAIRSEREGETWFKKITASMFYRLIYRITDVKIPLDTGDFRLLDRKVVDVLKTMRERHRILRGMAAWVGFKQVGVEYKTSIPLCRQDQVSLQADAQTGSKRHHRFFVFPIAACILHRVYFGWCKHCCHPGGHPPALDWFPGIYRAGHHLTGCPFPGGGPINISGYPGRIYRSSL